MVHRLAPLLACLVLPLGGGACVDKADRTPPTALSYASSSVTYTREVPAEENVPTVNGFVATWVASPALPDGLSLDRTTGVIGGTPTTTSPAQDYTIIATNVGGHTETIVNIAVAELTPPSALVYPDNPVTYTTMFDISPNVPTFTGIVLDWQVLPDLPAGLSIDQATGAITGTPTAAAPTRPYDVIASNPEGATFSSVTITVNQLTAPGFFLYSGNGAVYPRGVTIAENRPIPTPTSPATWTVAPSLPQGLFLNSVTGVISGVPTAVTPMATYVVTASNPLGTRSSNLILTVEDFQAVPSFFTAQQGEDSLASVILDPHLASGRLEHVTPATAGAAQTSIASTPDGLGVFTANNGLATIASFDADPRTGALQPLGSVASTADPFDLAVHPTGGFLYASSTSDGRIAKHVVNGDGTLGAEQGIVTNTAAPGRIHVATVGTDVRLYSVSPTMGMADHYAIDTMGDLAFVDAVSTSADPRAVVVVTTPMSNVFAYVTCGSGNVIDQFSVNATTGSLTPLAPASVNTPPGTTPDDVAADPTGTFLYLAASGATRIRQYAIDASAGTLSFVGPNVNTPAPPGAIEVSVDGTRVFAALPSLDEIQVFDIGAGGTLTAAFRVRTGATPIGITSAPTGDALSITSGFAYLPFASSGTLGQRSVAIDLATSTASLTPLAPAAVAGGAGTAAAALHPAQDYLVAVHQGAGTLTDYTRDTATGLLTQQTGDTTMLMGPTAVAIEPTGRFAYVVEASGNALVPVVLDQVTSPLTLGTSLPIGTDSRAVAIDPTGRFVYTVSNGQARVDGFAISLADGSLTFLTGTPFTTQANPQDVVVHGSGRFLYTANAVGSISAFSIDAAGDLSPLAPAQVTTPAGSMPGSLVLRPDGLSLYVAYPGTSELARFIVDPDTGALSASEVVATAGVPGEVSIDASGKLVTVTLPATDEVQHFLVATDGTLSAGGVEDVGEAAGRPVFSREVQ